MYEGDRPRSEPEIIPPDRNRRRGDTDRRQPWRADEDFVESQHIYVTRIGPWGGLWFALGIGAMTALAVILIFGAFLFLLPLFGAIVVAGLIARWLRGGSTRGPWQ